jgi:pimeloyl-ACP methyl ester carboxylesterase
MNIIRNATTDTITRRCSINFSRHLIEFLFLSLAAGCVAENPLKLAAENGFEQHSILGNRFLHTVLRRPASVDSTSAHIYIEGDGIPWINGWVAADDPTPRNALGLKLASLDPNEVVYVGRPCYFGHAKDPGCDSFRWTSGRYSNEVVDSIADAINATPLAEENSPIVLIGYSGGGTLAALLANRVPNVTAVLTIAANLDTDVWTDHHGYDPLHDSLNPATQLMQPEVPHVQLVGGQDDVVPPAVSDSYKQRHTELVLWKFEKFDHVCCWEQQWPAILHRFQNHIESAQNTQTVENIDTSGT